LTRDVAGELGIKADFIKVKTLPEIMAYDVMTTPALVVNEKVLSSGRIPSRDEVKSWLQAV